MRGLACSSVADESARPLPTPADDGAASAETPAAAPAHARTWTLAWFPAGERERARELWPDLAPDLADDRAYRQNLEAELRRLDQHGPRRPQLVAMNVDDLVAFARHEGLDAGSPEARNRYAAAQADAGTAEPWPPGRNDPCWCGSGDKYKRCCGAL